MREPRDRARARVARAFRDQSLARYKENGYPKASSATDAAERAKRLPDIAARVEAWAKANQDDPEAWAFLSGEEIIEAKARLEARKLAFTQELEARALARLRARTQEKRAATLLAKIRKRQQNRARSA